MSVRPIVIDCDPGQDDFINILLALASPAEVRVDGITTVGGNVALEGTHRNARLACELAGVEVPVYAGCGQPLMKPLQTAEHVHGASGVGGYPVTEPRAALSAMHAVDFIVEHVRAGRDERPTLVATGPLTNIAMALKKAPDIAARLDEIVLMGGARCEGGNMTPSAEFNIGVDPHAADIVFRSAVPITAFGLDVTHQFVMTRERRESLRALATQAGRAVADMLDCAARHDGPGHGGDGAPLHDPCTLLYLLRPDLFERKPCAIRIETEAALTAGHTAVDFSGVTPSRPNAEWAYGIDAEAAFELMKQRIARL